MTGDAGPWQRWQREHTEALAALQQTQRAYHREVATRAFGAALNDPEEAVRRKALLGRVEAARIRLDEIRARQPHP